LSIEVQVRDNNIEAAIRVLKKKLLREGIFKELKLRKNYEKPSAIRVLKKKLLREGIFKELKLRKNYEKPSERKLRETKESEKRFKKLMRKKKYD